MIRFQVNGLGHKFRRKWLFKDLSFALEKGERLLITGANGSGKSTLLRILAGQLSPTRGEILFTRGKAKIERELWYRHLSWDGPYFDLYQDLSLEEAVKLHFRFKENILKDEKAVMEAIRLWPHRSKPLKNYSSGMLQRVKAGLAIFSKSDLLLLDEVSATLDQENSNYIYSLIEEHLGDRMLIFASNNPGEFGMFERRLEIVGVEKGKSRG